VLPDSPCPAKSRVLAASEEGVICCGDWAVREPAPPSLVISVITLMRSCIVVFGAQSGGNQQNCLAVISAQSSRNQNPCEAFLRLARSQHVNQMLKTNLLYYTNPGALLLRVMLQRQSRESWSGADARNLTNTERPIGNFKLILSRDHN
jgi:hypothetical protein